MNWREWLGISKRKPMEVIGVIPAPFEARLPEPMGTARIDPRSASWIFVRQWAEEKLQKAREKNDSANRDITQTSLLRGEIKILKELISLPNPRTVKGLLEEE